MAYGRTVEIIENKINQIGERQKLIDEEVALFLDVIKAIIKITKQYDEENEINKKLETGQISGLYRRKTFYKLSSDYFYKNKSPNNKDEETELENDDDDDVNKNQLSFLESFDETYNIKQERLNARKTLRELIKRKFELECVRQGVTGERHYFDKPYLCFDNALDEDGVVSLGSFQGDFDREQNINLIKINDMFFNLNNGKSFAKAVASTFFTTIHEVRHAKQYAVRLVPAKSQKKVLTTKEDDIRKKLQRADLEIKKDNFIRKLKPDDYPTLQTKNGELNIANIFLDLKNYNYINRPIEVDANEEASATAMQSIFIMTNHLSYEDENDFEEKNKEKIDAFELFKNDTFERIESCKNKRKTFKNPFDVSKNRKTIANYLKAIENDKTAYNKLYKTLEKCGFYGDTATLFAFYNAETFAENNKKAHHMKIDF
jgi:hypothetical protein